MKEMGKNELKQVDGGLIHWAAAALVGALIGIVLTQDLDALGDSFMEGWNDAAAR